MPDYPFTIQSTPFYAAELPTWLSKGRANFLSNGLPSPYQPGEFSILLNAIAVTSPSTYGGMFATSGTYQDLFNIYVNAQNSSDGVVSVVCLDPSTNEYITIGARMKPPLKLAGGAAMGNITVEFFSAFISDEIRATYYGGDPNPPTDDPPYIPGDPVTPGDAALVGWNHGKWNEAIWNQEGV
jgi:hypothetical protein